MLQPQGNKVTQQT